MAIQLKSETLIKEHWGLEVKKIRKEGRKEGRKETFTL